jgi:hypothetical protein
METGTSEKFELPPMHYLSEIDNLYISHGFFSINPNTNVFDNDFEKNIKYILAILLSKVKNDISKINKNSITINIQKESLPRNLSLYRVLEFIKEKFLNGTPLHHLEISDEENQNEKQYEVEYNYKPTDLVDELFDKILEKNDNTKLSHYFGYQPTGRYRLKMKWPEKLYRSSGGKHKQRKTKKRKSKKRQMRMLL